MATLLTFIHSRNRTLIRAIRPIFIVMDRNNDGIIAAMMHKLEESYDLQGYHAAHDKILDYEVLAYIGRGSFGQVRLIRAKDRIARKEYQLFALKNIAKEAMSSKPRERIHAERDVLVKAKGTPAQEWLVKIHQAFQVALTTSMISCHLITGSEEPLFGSRVSARRRSESLS